MCSLRCDILEYTIKCADHSCSTIKYNLQIVSNVISIQWTIIAETVEAVHLNSIDTLKRSFFVRACVCVRAVFCIVMLLNPFIGIFDFLIDTRAQ